MVEWKRVDDRVWLGRFGFDWPYRISRTWLLGRYRAENRDTGRRAKFRRIEDAVVWCESDAWRALNRIRAQEALRKAEDVR